MKHFNTPLDVFDYTDVCVHIFYKIYLESFLMKLNTGCKNALNLHIFFVEN
jgi:hypothetical protein